MPRSKSWLFVDVLDFADEFDSCIHCKTCDIKAPAQGMLNSSLPVVYDSNLQQI